MKKLLTIILILFSVSCLSAKVNVNNKKAEVKSLNIETAALKDTINISNMVQKQIESARQKEIQIKKINAEAAILPLVEENAKSILGLNPMPFLSSIYFSKGFILIYASIFIALFIFIKRVKNKKNDSAQNLKNAINILRNEVAVKKQNKKLEKLRRKIHASNQLSNFGEQEIIKIAKKLQISKDELLLAVKIKSHQLKNNYSRKIY